MPDFDDDISTSAPDETATPPNTTDMDLEIIEGRRSDVIVFDEDIIRADPPAEPGVIVIDEPLVITPTEPGVIVMPEEIIHGTPPTGAEDVIVMPEDTILGTPPTVIDMEPEIIEATPPTVIDMEPEVIEVPAPTAEVNDFQEDTFESDLSNIATMEQQLDQLGDFDS